MNGKSRSKLGWRERERGENETIWVLKTLQKKGIFCEVCEKPLEGSREYHYPFARLDHSGRCEENRLKKGKS